LSQGNDQVSTVHLEGRWRSTWEIQNGAAVLLECIDRRFSGWIVVHIEYRSTSSPKDECPVECVRIVIVLEYPKRLQAKFQGMLASSEHYVIVCFKIPFAVVRISGG